MVRTTFSESTTTCRRNAAYCHSDRDGVSYSRLMEQDEGGWLRVKRSAYPKTISRLRVGRRGIALL